MGFTTQIFLFGFFPASVLCWLLVKWATQWGLFGKWVKKLRLQDLVLVGFSLLFYAWALVDHVPMLCAYVVLVWLAGTLIHHSYRRGKYIKCFGGASKTKKVFTATLWMALAVTGVVCVLVAFKYTSFLANTLDRLLGAGVSIKSTLAPLGISFITFSAISYLVDVYRGHAEPGSLLDCALYLTFFPKVVSGPIVLWKDFSSAMTSRRITLDRVVEGINRIMMGFAKKIILADSFGTAITAIGNSYVDRISAASTLVLYMLQIYFDFSGYSDIAIGLAKLFGFDFKENFNFPYRSVSVSEFWRRWHISLGTWFREYVYFPLGGSRCTLKRNLCNLAVVFLLTGIWHGAGWNYILWGCANGAFVLLERILRDGKFYQKTPKWIKYIVTMGVTMLLWQLFRFSSLNEAVRWMQIILGQVRYDRVIYSWQYHWDVRLITLTVVGLLGATVLGSPRLKRLYERIVSTPWGVALRQLWVLALFVLSIVFMVNSTYSPFIYFQY